MTDEERKKIYQQLSAPFPEEAIERTEGRVTGRGYDTTGIKYIYVAARMNEVLGIGCYRTQQTIAVREVTTSKGRQAFDATCDITLHLGTWDGGTFMPWAEAFATGGHQSVSESDAKKGAYTNAFKKAAAMLGAGQQAYMGTLDDDAVPAEEMQHTPPPRQQSRPVPASPSSRPSQPGATPQKPSSPATHQAPTATQSGPPPVQAAPEATHATQATQPTPNQSPARNRLTSKQLGALNALARKLQYTQQQFRQQVKATYGVQPEFLDKVTASTLIGQLSARASNGHSHPTGEQGTEA